MKAGNDYATIVLGLSYKKAFEFYDIEMKNFYQGANNWNELLLWN